MRRIEQGVALPSTASVDAPARQRTLHDAIAWSYGLLDRPDQLVLARTSEFVGGFSGPAADVCVPDPADDPPIDVLRSLDRLIDQSLVRVAADAKGEPRFSLLETILSSPGSISPSARRSDSPSAMPGSTRKRPSCSLTTVWRLRLTRSVMISRMCVRRSPGPRPMLKRTSSSGLALLRGRSSGLWGTRTRPAAGSRGPSVPRPRPIQPSRAAFCITSLATNSPLVATVAVRRPSFRGRWPFSRRWRSSQDHEGPRTAVARGVRSR